MLNVALHKNRKKNGVSFVIYRFENDNDDDNDKNSMIIISEYKLTSPV